MQTFSSAQRFSLLSKFRLLLHYFSLWTRPKKNTNLWVLVHLLRYIVSSGNAVQVLVCMEFERKASGTTAGEGNAP
jgi:hypothetical protein